MRCVSFPHINTQIRNHATAIVIATSKLAGPFSATRRRGRSVVRASTAGFCHRSSDRASPRVRFEWMGGGASRSADKNRPRRSSVGAGKGTTATGPRGTQGPGDHQRPRGAGGSGGLGCCRRRDFKRRAIKAQSWKSSKHSRRRWRPRKPSGCGPSGRQGGVAEAGLPVARSVQREAGRSDQLGRLGLFTLQ